MLVGGPTLKIPPASNAHPCGAFTTLPLPRNPIPSARELKVAIWARAYATPYMRAREDMLRKKQLLKSSPGAARTSASNATDAHQIGTRCHPCPPWTRLPILDRHAHQRRPHPGCGGWRGKRGRGTPSVTAPTQPARNHPRRTKKRPPAVGTAGGCHGDPAHQTRSPRRRAGRLHTRITADRYCWVQKSNFSLQAPSAAARMSASNATDMHQIGTRCSPCPPRARLPILATAPTNGVPPAPANENGVNNTIFLTSNCPILASQNTLGHRHTTNTPRHTLAH